LFVSAVPGVSGPVRCANHSVTYTFSSLSFASPLLVIAIARGCASAGRAATAPRSPVPASVAFRSMVLSIVIVSGLITEMVPSTQFAT
jgi:hypothetical protein